MPGHLRTRLLKTHEALWFDCKIRLAVWFLRGLLVTLRPVYVQRHVEQRLWHADQPFLLAFWHGRSLYFIRLYRQYAFTVLVSHSRDGEFISRILRHFGIHTSRGSSHRHGSQGFLQMVQKMRQGYRGAVTPDGPRGPCYQVHPGIVALAKRTGVPILPVTYSARWKWQVRSWDRFVIPLPFSRVVVLYGEPIEVPPTASATTLQAKRQEVEVSLQRLTAMADTYFRPAS